jgi:hypothetical protein
MFEVFDTKKAVDSWNTPGLSARGSCKLKRILLKQFIDYPQVDLLKPLSVDWYWIR